MLKKIVGLKNVGLLHDGIPKTAHLEQAILVYAENGRGKTTLANVLRALGKGDAQAVLDCQTIDSIDPPQVTLLVEVGKSTTPVEFRNGTWSGPSLDVFVFDPTFIEDNVFSGQEVRPDQRQALLQFALGAESVALERALADLTGKISDETKKITNSGKRIAAFGKQMPIPEFIGLSDDPNAEKLIVELQGRLEAARNAEALSRRLKPEKIPQIELNIDSLFEIFASNFDGIRSDAKDTVLKHFDSHKSPSGIEEWVAKGREFSAEKGCPFCGQGVANADLLDAYDAYFNRSYEDFMGRVSALGRGVEARLPAAKIEGIASQVSINAARTEAWADHIPIKVSEFDVDTAGTLFTELRRLVDELTLAKQRRPLESIGTQEQKMTIGECLRELRGLISAYNDEVDQRSAEIGEFLRRLAADSPATISAQISRLEAVVAKRHRDAQSAILEYQGAEAEKNRLVTEKEKAKEALAKKLPETLEKYEGQVNILLKRFGAGFSIEKFRSDNHGGMVRTDYGLKLRGKSVKLGKRDDRLPGFKSVLSEGDKRTLALAFFLARLRIDQHALGGKLIVLDDPVCSMDAARRKKTIESIGELASGDAQIIVFSHDATFLLDLRDHLHSPSHDRRTSVHEIARVASGYSEFSDCDLDAICQSIYEIGHEKVRNFVDGKPGAPLLEVARELRPLVEGYLHRKFPSPLLARDSSLGKMISGIRDAPASSPLTHAKPFLAKLTSLNDYSTPFQHGNAKHETRINEDELIQFAKATLEIIYGDPETN